MKSILDSIHDETKQVLLGEKSLNPVFLPLVEWIDNTYDVVVAHVVFELVEHENNGIVPKLEVSFKYTEDFRKFQDKNQFFLDFAKRKAVAEKFKEIILDQGLSQKDVLKTPYNTSESAQYLEENVHVIFSDFESREKDVINGEIPRARINALLEKIDNSDIWQVSRFYSGTTFFLYTDKQLGNYINTDVHEKWTDMYFELLQEYDQFGYFVRDSFHIMLDSKESFDRKDKGNLYSYYK